MGAKVSRGETWSFDAYLDRVHMRMGVRFFHLLSPVMKKRFCAEYPQAFSDVADSGNAESSAA